VAALPAPAIPLKDIADWVEYYAPLEESFDRLGSYRKQLQRRKGAGIQRKEKRDGAKLNVVTKDEPSS